jgi:hypothetical protein
VLNSSDIFKHAIKWVYQDAWAASIEESHPASAARDALLATFWREVGVIEKALRPVIPALLRMQSDAGAAEQVRWDWL